MDGSSSSSCSAGLSPPALPADPWRGVPEEPWTLSIWLGQMSGNGARCSFLGNAGDRLLSLAAGESPTGSRGGGCGNFLLINQAKKEPLPGGSCLPAALPLLAVLSQCPGLPLLSLFCESWHLRVKTPMFPPHLSSEFLPELGDEMSMSCPAHCHVNSGRWQRVGTRGPE